MSKDNFAKKLGSLWASGGLSSGRDIEIIALDASQRLQRLVYGKGIESIGYVGLYVSKGFVKVTFLAKSTFDLSSQTS